MSKRGIFVTFEGPEGSGKTTHSKLLCDFLRKKGFRVTHTREPGGTLIGEKIRRILLDPENRQITVLCEMLLYMAARAQIVEERISPALKKGKVVICDRFTDATLAYQGYGAGQDIKGINYISRLVTGGIRPDITFLLDIESERGLSRSGNIKDRLEMKSLAYHRRVRKAYLAIARKEPVRVKVVSADGDIEQTQNEIRQIFLKFLKRQKTQVI